MKKLQSENIEGHLLISCFEFVRFHNQFLSNLEMSNDTIFHALFALMQP